MKRIMLFAAALLALSCTEQARVRKFGGEMEFVLPAGERLLTVTWRDDNLFYLTEPMEEDYVPRRKTFRESSSYGLHESVIVFIESRADGTTPAAEQPAAAEEPAPAEQPAVTEQPAAADLR